MWSAASGKVAALQMIFSFKTFVLVNFTKLAHI